MVEQLAWKGLPQVIDRDELDVLEHWMTGAHDSALSIINEENSIRRNAVRILFPMTETRMKQVSTFHGTGTVFWGAVVYLLLASTTIAVSGHSALPGNHPLTQSQAGDLLVQQFRCAACHSGLNRDVLKEKTAPDLARAGARISPVYLKQFIASPLSAHFGTTMPDVLASKPDDERQMIAEALTHFLVAQSNGEFRVEPPSDESMQLGKTLYHTVGCVACHGPREAIGDTGLEKSSDAVLDDEDKRTDNKNEIKPIAVSLGHVAAKYSVKSLGEFLFQPLRVRPSGRMPDMKLTTAESLAVASYLIGAEPKQVTSLQLQESLVSLGRRYFQEMNCAACHSLNNIPGAPLIGSLRNAELSRGCLSQTAGKGPKFQLDSAQVQAIKTSLTAEPKVETEAVVLAKTLTTFNCIACHIRDDFGGVSESYNSYFTTGEQKLGDDGRIPPPLTMVGAKLQSAWMKKVLFDGESVRHYMTTRMPQFGAANLSHLPKAFAQLDVLPSPDWTIPSPESDSESVRQREKLLRPAGRELLGDKGLNCIACHNFNGKPAPVNKGIDLMTTFQRLQPGWFNSFVRNPGSFRPRIVMPTAWPNGVAAHKTILDGNTDLQIQAIWYYLSLGTSAADPSGIRNNSTTLSVGSSARTFRGRSRVAGFRGIAVGLPEKLNYAFNAETGTLSAIWQGDFISVNWNGQGSGDFNPAREPITLPQDVSFTKLADEDSPWPMMPVMTKDARVNPNPLYPKNLGYQFRGYFLGESSIPTFMYQYGAIEIEDRSVATVTNDPRGLRRVLQFDSPTPIVIWFRGLVGDIRNPSEHVFHTGNLRLTVPGVKTKLRQVSEEPKRSELLLRLELPQGKSNLELLYEPLQK